MSDSKTPSSRPDSYWLDIIDELKDEVKHGEKLVELSQKAYDTLLKLQQRPSYYCEFKETERKLATATARIKELEKDRERLASDDDVWLTVCEASDILWKYKNELNGYNEDLQKCINELLMEKFNGPPAQHIGSEAEARVRAMVASEYSKAFRDLDKQLKDTQADLKAEISKLKKQ